MSTNKVIGGEFTPVDFEGWLGRGPGALSREFFPEVRGDYHRHLFETGADALADILLETNTNKPVIAYPVHFCPDTIERTKVKLAFHGCSAVFEPYRGPGNAVRADAVLAVHFNRYEGEIKKSFPPGDYLFVEDFVHCPLDMDNMSVPYAFTSLRKFSFLSVAVSYKKSAGNAGVPGPSEYLLKRKQATGIKSTFQKKRDKADETRYLRLFERSERCLVTDGAIRSADPEETSYLGRLDFAALREIRRKNRSTLGGLFSKLPCSVLPGDYMYLMIDTPRRDELRAKMFDNNIFPPVHWLDAPSELARSIMSFHVDQRYDDEDFERVARVAADFYGA